MVYSIEWLYWGQGYTDFGLLGGNRIALLYASNASLTILVGSLQNMKLSNVTPTILGVFAGKYMYYTQKESKTNIRVVF
jgi:hypothetical protein